MYGAINIRSKRLFIKPIPQENQSYEVYYKVQNSKVEEEILRSIYRL